MAASSVLEELAEKAAREKLGAEPCAGYVCYTPARFSRAVIPCATGLRYC